MCIHMKKTQKFLDFKKVLNKNLIYSLKNRQKFFKIVPQFVLVLSNR